MWGVQFAIHVPCKYRSRNKVLFLRGSTTLFLDASGIYEFWLTKCFFIRDVLFCKQVNERNAKEIKAINLLYDQKWLFFSNNDVYINGTYVKIQFLLRRKRGPCSLRWFITLCEVIFMISVQQPGSFFDCPTDGPPLHFACTFCYLGGKKSELTYRITRKADVHCVTKRDFHNVRATCVFTSLI